MITLNNLDYLRIILDVVLTRVVTVTLVRTRMVLVAIVDLIFDVVKMLTYPCRCTLESNLAASASKCNVHK